MYKVDILLANFFNFMRILVSVDRYRLGVVGRLVFLKTDDGITVEL